MSKITDLYTDKIVPNMVKRFGLSNKMEVSKPMKICVNSGIGDFRDNKEAVESFVHDLSQLTGQKPYPRKARLSISGFKIRKGDVVGYLTTLRGKRMWSFLDKLINAALPRVRDFRGLKRSAFDKDGNFSLGIQEHVIFPEVNPNTTKGIRNLQISIVFSSSNKEMNEAVLEELGMPLKK